MKTIISITLDEDVAKELNKYKNRSDKINKLLRFMLLTEKGIEEQIEIEQLEKKRILKHLKSQLEAIRKRNKILLNDIPLQLKKRLKEAKEALNRDPSKLNMWVSILSNDFPIYSLENIELLLKKTIYTNISQ